MNKARRGELINNLPIGYFKLPSKEVILDPDEQVQATVRLLFEKFVELGSASAVLRYFVKNGIKLGIRPHDGPTRGQLEWRRPSIKTIVTMLHHPIYAGAYCFGRSQIDEDNQGKLKLNSARASSYGAPREGPSLLSGLLVCSKCGARMRVNYNSRVRAHRYVCIRQKVAYGEESCQTLAGKPLDELVTKQVLQVLEPAALQLSLRVVGDIQRERERLTLHWKQQMERANYEAKKAERHYRAVDPENRLVARALEQQWEKALLHQKQIIEDFERFQERTPARLSEVDRACIQALAWEIPALWHAPTTTNVDRQQIIRHVVERIVVNVDNNCEYIEATIYWAGGFVSQHETVRSVAAYEQLRDYPQLKRRVLELADAGKKAKEIAEALNGEGFRPAKRRVTFNRVTVRQFLKRLGRIGPCLRLTPKLPRHEWWVTQLSLELEMPTSTVTDWIYRGWVHARKEPGAAGRWICSADAEELDRLRRLRATPPSSCRPYPAELTTPKALTPKPR